MSLANSVHVYLASLHLKPKVEPHIFIIRNCNHLGGRLQLPKASGAPAKPTGT
jgi:hypothetical protein